MPDRGRFERAYLRLHDAAERRAPLVIAVFLTTVAVALFGLGSLKLDLSFRPLFASGANVAAPTAEFEQVFGQSSGAWIAAILENRELTPTEFVRESARLADRVRTLAGFDDVLSLTDVWVPEWHGGNLSLRTPIPNWLLDPAEDEELGYQYAELLDGTRWVGWLVSADGRRLLLAARLESALDDLDVRRAAVTAFESLLDREVPESIGLQITGVSVVELAYEREVLLDQVAATVIMSALLALLLYALFTALLPVVVCLLPVSLAIAATLGLMGWLQQPMTLINTTLPAIVLIIGVADAVHMLIAWLGARGDGQTPAAATRQMLSVTGKACFFTTVTTMGGFLALASAELQAIAGFGVSVALGILLAWAANQILLPWLLRRAHAGERLPSGLANRLAEQTLLTAIRQSIGRPGLIVAGSLLLAIPALALLPSLRIDQRFNEELPAEHPASVAQRDFDRHFGGFLGPEIDVRAVDGENLLGDDAWQKLAEFERALRELPDTRHVWSLRDLLPGVSIAEDRRAALETLRTDDAGAASVGEFLSPDNSRLAVIVRLGDIGTERAHAYRAEVLRLAEQTWGEAFAVDVVGQWWLAQHGMGLLLSDMLTSLATALIIVLPLMWLALRDWRLMLAATAANLLPLLLPLAFMAATGISVRIGTAVVLAIALGIVVDNTLHIIIRLRAAADAGRIDLDTAMRGTGRAIVFTSLALIGGFLSMLTNDLLVIRDMGLVAAVAIAGAMLADLWLLPAIYVLLNPAIGGAEKPPAGDVALQ